MVIGAASLWNCRPSELMCINDGYTAFCLDEACAYIKARMMDGEEPKFKKQYKSFSDIYK